MKDTTNNLLIFMLANNGLRVGDDGSKIVTAHTRLGNKILAGLVGDGASVEFIQARFHKNRSARWEYLKQKSPALAELEEEFGFKP